MVDEQLCGADNPYNACQTASDEYGIYAGVGFGFAPSNVQTWWTASSCDVDPQVPYTNSCQTASNEYGMSSGSAGWAPSAVQTWFSSNSCATSPQPYSP